MYMFEDLLATRLAKLRIEKGVSAREMSLGIGQNCSYINRIENRKSMPSMQCFLYICEYLGVTPAEFFAEDNDHPLLVNELAKELQDLSSEQLEIVRGIITDIKKLNK